MADHEGEIESALMLFRLVAYADLFNHLGKLTHSFGLSRFYMVWEFLEDDSSEFVNSLSLHS